MTVPRGQLPDGGFPASWSAGQSSLDATCYQLDVGELTSEQRNHALDFVLRQRSPDGTWHEPEELAALVPAWLVPGDQDALAYLSWNCALVLVRAGRLQDPPPVLPRGYRQTRWLAAATLLWLGRIDDAEPLLDELEAVTPELDDEERGWLRRALAPFTPFSGRPGLTTAASPPES